MFEILAMQCCGLIVHPRKTYTQSVQHVTDFCILLFKHDKTKYEDMIQFLLTCWREMKTVERNANKQTNKQTINHTHKGIQTGLPIAIQTGIKTSIHI